MTQPDRVGHTVGRFELGERLGAGGMGVVYRARDTRLGREVAVKLLAQSLADDPDAMRRFELEARAASSLNHPNIVTVFDAGVDGGQPFIVTELLQGQTLDARLARGPLPSGEATTVATQVAAALAAAHAANLVHRDIKPQNIFLTRSGTVKLLDFGVARLLRRHVGAAGGDGTTVTSATQEGAIVGTLGYMAPEQVRGEAVDARTDVFAFGCVLHEMLGGTAPFARPTAADSMVAVLAEPPDPLPVGTPVPPLLDRIRARCLEKEPAERFQSAADLRFALEAAREGSGAAPGAAVGPGTGAAPARASAAGRTVPIPVAAGVLLTAVIAAWMLGQRGEAETGPVVESASIVVPSSARPIAPAVAPDGQWVAYIGLAGGTPNLYVQPLNRGAPVTVAAGTELPLQTRTIVGSIDVTPDGTGILVAGRPNPGGLWQVPGIWVVPAPLGGPARRLTDRYGAVRWSPDGTRIAAILADPLIGDAVAVAGPEGQDERVLVPPLGGLHRHQVAWGHDGRYVYYSQTLEAARSFGEIWRVPAAGGAPELVVPSQGGAMYPAPTPDGRGLLYAGDRPGEGFNIWWHPFDGSPERRLTTGAGEYTEPFVSRDGRHVVALVEHRRGGIVRVDATPGGRAVLEEVTRESVGDGDPSTSATGRMVVTSSRGGLHQIWSVGLDGRIGVPITSGRVASLRPVITRDGAQVAFVSSASGKRGLWTVSADGGTPRLVVEAPVVDFPSWSGDGKRLVYAAASGANTDLWIVPAGGGAPVRVPATDARVPVWSPVSGEIAYVGVREGKPYVHFVDSTGATVRPSVLIEGVSLPTAMAWSPDGTRLAMVNLPGRAAAQVFIADVASGALRRLVEAAPPAVFEGVSWSPDGRSLFVGHITHDTEVLLLRLR